MRAGLLTIFLAASATFVACGPEGPTKEDQIRACIEADGVRTFTSDKFGNVVSYFGCSGAAG